MNVWNLQFQRTFILTLLSHNPVDRYVRKDKRPCAYLLIKTFIENLHMEHHAKHCRRDEKLEKSVLEAHAI